MDPDNYQQAWQAQSSQTRVTIDADLLHKEVQRSQRNFRAVIFWRDFREVGIALLLLPLWIYLGVTTSSPWTWYLTVPVLVWLAGFMLVYRIRHKQKPSKPDEPLLHCVESSLTEQEDQIWLLRNIFWWYLLPPGISILAFFAHSTWLRSEGWLDALGHMDVFVFFFALFYFLYLVNQYCVHSQLEPRRQELLTLLRSLRDETTGDDAHNMDTALCVSPLNFAARFAIAGGALLLAVLIAVAADCLETASRGGSDRAGLSATEYAKKSPFAAVRWQESQPEVRLGEEWFKLVSLDELPTSEIVAFSQRTYGNLWRKRFEEDLVELLTRMGHPPRDKVTLVVQSLTSSETWVREGVPMTEANRRALRAAAQTRVIPEPRRERVARTAVSIENSEQFCDHVNEFLQLARVKTGFSGVVVVARGGDPVYQGAFGFSHLEFRIRNSSDTPF